MNLCVLQLEYPSKAPPPQRTHLLPPGSTRMLVLCDTFHPLSFFAIHPASFFPVFPLFSFLSVSSMTTLLYLRFSSSPPPPPRLFSFSALPPVHFTPTHPLSLSLLLSPASLTGTEERFELTPVAAISVHLLAGDGVELQVNGAITVSVPLPANSGLKENDHIPAWRFDPRLGMY